MIGAFEGRIDLGRDEGANAGVGCGTGKENMVDAVWALVGAEGEPGVVWALVDVGVCLRDEHVGVAKVVVNDIGGGGMGRCLEGAGMVMEGGDVGVGVDEGNIDGGVGAAELG